MKDIKERMRQYAYTERLAFAFLAGVFFIDTGVGIIPAPWYQYLFFALTAYYVTQQLLLKTRLYRWDGVFHYKSRKSSFQPNPGWKSKPINRKGVGFVILFYLIFVATMMLLRRNQLLSWPLYMGGACSILMLNNLFIYYKCPFQEFLLKDVTCCADCHIAAWDYFIFATGLLFVPDASLLSRGISWFLWGVSTVLLVVWEVNVQRYPERFSPEGNRCIGCQTCPKPCTHAHNYRSFFCRKR